METTAKFRPNVQVACDAENLARQTAGLFVSAARDAIRLRGVFYVALSGGSTPRRFFELLPATAESQFLPWEKVQVFWVDERYVPPDSSYSNYRLAADTFLSKVEIPPANIHRIPTEYDDIKVAARTYAQTIREVFRLREGQVPSLDLVVLGMGTDGHTGSLFPNSYAPFDTEDLACVVYVLGDALSRITLTHPVLRAARCLAVLVSGAEKADTLRAVLTEEPDEVKYPIHILWPALEKITWFVDRAAARSI
ncbi:MAG: 6-phosphogluconolactonase [Sedimentisphaerales bacterium]|nr:6-phosphogluconolactonase [Sedimentisphaerales bacterium]